jgi:hypothetical protein
VGSIGEVSCSCSAVVSEGFARMAGCTVMHGVTPVVLQGAVEGISIMSLMFLIC